LETGTESGGSEGARELLQGMGNHITSVLHTHQIQQDDVSPAKMVPPAVKVGKKKKTNFYRKSLPASKSYTARKEDCGGGKRDGGGEKRPSLPGLMLALSEEGKTKNSKPGEA